MSTVVEGFMGVRWEDVGAAFTDLLTLPTGARTTRPELNLYPRCIRCELTFVGEPGGIFRQPDALAIYGGTGSTVIVIASGGTFSVAPAVTTSEVDLSVAARIEYTRRHLSLSMTHLAVIMGVTRTTLYAWQDGTSLPRARSLRLLGKLTEVARQWEERSPEPLGAYLMTPLKGGSTFLDLLSAARWDRGAIEAAVDALATAVDWTRRQRPASPPSPETGSAQLSIDEQRKARRLESRRLFRPR